MFYRTRSLSSFQICLAERAFLRAPEGPRQRPRLTTRRRGRHFSVVYTGGMNEKMQPQGVPDFKAPDDAIIITRMRDLPVMLRQIMYDLDAAEVEIAIVRNSDDQENPNLWGEDYGPKMRLVARHRGAQTMISLKNDPAQSTALFPLPDFEAWLKAENRFGHHIAPANMAFKITGYKTDSPMPTEDASGRGTISQDESVEPWPEPTADDLRPVDEGPHVAVVHSFRELFQLERGRDPWLFAFFHDFESPYPKRAVLEVFVNDDTEPVVLELALATSASRRFVCTDRVRSQRHRDRLQALGIDPEEVNQMTIVGNPESERQFRMRVGAGVDDDIRLIRVRMLAPDAQDELE